MEPPAGATALPSEEGRTPAVWVRDGVVYRHRSPSSTSVHAVLRHLEAAGFAASPRVVGDGFEGSFETVTYLPGKSPHPGGWSDAAIVELGLMIRDLHKTMRSFEAPSTAVWMPWYPRGLEGGHDPIIGHGDLGPWNILATGGLPRQLIDWECAGPTDSRVELAQVAWLNCQLHDDDVAARNDLAPAAARAAQLGLLLDAYGLSNSSRPGFVDLMVEVAIRDAANDARTHVTPSTTGSVAEDGYPFLWGIAWRARSAAWMLEHRTLLEAALTPGA